MIQRIRFSLFLLLAFSSGFSQGVATDGISLDEAIKIALKFNHDVKNARLGEVQAKARNWEILTLGMPNITSNFDYSYYFLKPTVPGLNKFFLDPNSASNQVYKQLASAPSTSADFAPLINKIAQESKGQTISFTLSHNINAGILLSQLVFDAKYFIGVSATKALTLTARLQTSLTAQDIKYNIAKAYYQAATAVEAKRLLQTSATVIEKLLNDTRATYKEGLIEELDVDRLELAFTNLQNQIQIQNQLADIALSNLKYQMGLKLDSDIKLHDNLQTLRNLVEVQEVTNFKASRRIEYEALQTAIKLHEFDIRQRRANYYPALYGMASYGGGSQVDNFKELFQKNAYNPAQNNWYQQGFVGFSLKVPIFDSGQKMFSVRQAKVELEKSKNDLENFKNAAQLQVQSAQTSFNSALLDEANSKKVLALSEKIFKKNQTKVKEGAGSSFELTQSEQDFITSQLKYVQSELNILNTKADLDKALGIR